MGVYIHAPFTPVHRYFMLQRLGPGYKMEEFCNLLNFECVIKNWHFPTFKFQNRQGFWCYLACKLKYWKQCPLQGYLYLYRTAKTQHTRWVILRPTTIPVTEHRKTYLWLHSHYFGYVIDVFTRRYVSLHVKVCFSENKLWNSFSDK